MAQLSINPHGHVVRDGRTLAEIIADEEYLEPDERPVETKDEKKEEKKMKFLSFELDMTYPRTLRGFVRTIQILLLLVSFVCLVLTNWGDAQGAYTFYCIVLVVAVIISGFLFFTIIAGSRSGKVCGFAWVKIELLYFFLFGFLVFIGACLAASNNVTGNPALNAGAAFGFIACITFALYIFWTWKDYKNPPGEDEKDDENNEEKKNEDDLEKGLHVHPHDNGNMGPRTESQRRKNSLIDPPENENGDLRIDPPINRGDNFRSSQSHRFIDNSKRSLDGQLPILSRDGMIDPKRKSDQFYRRHRSASDKDSAYSEGSMNDRDRSLPTKIRRTASMRDANRARQPVKTSRHHAGDRRMHHSAERRPRQLSAAELMNDEHRQRKSVPNWLKAALDDDEPDIPRICSTMPAARRKNEFPLLHTSDEESVAYPSVSQTLGNQREPKWNHGGRVYRENHHHTRRGINHGRHNAAHGRGSKRPHPHGHRILHNHGKRHGHGHGQNRGHHRHGDRHGRMGPGHQRTRQHPSHARVRPQDDAFLRKMMENDQLVDRRVPNPRPGEQRAPRQRLHETPSSLHFPERSRWDDHDMEIPERGVTKAMIENYLESA